MKAKERDGDIWFLDAPWSISSSEGNRSAMIEVCMCLMAGYMDSWMSEYLSVCLSPGQSSQAFSSQVKSSRVQ